MSDNEVIIRLTALLLLLAFLVHKQVERRRSRAAFHRQFQREGEVINVAPLRPRLEALRQNFSQVAQEHSRAGRAQEGLVASARQKLRSLPFFQSPSSQPEGEHHTA
jgi:Flp pilus assembly protein TadB